MENICWRYFWMCNERRTVLLSMQRDFVGGRDRHGGAILTFSTDSVVVHVCVVVGGRDRHGGAILTFSTDSVVVHVCVVVGGRDRHGGAILTFSTDSVVVHVCVVVGGRDRHGAPSSHSPLTVLSFMSVLL